MIGATVDVGVLAGVEIGDGVYDGLWFLAGSGSVEINQARVGLKDWEV